MRMRAGDKQSEAEGWMTLVALAATMRSLRAGAPRVRGELAAGVSPAGCLVNRRRRHTIAHAAETTTTEASKPSQAEKAPERRKRALSGAQPTGILHLGNYYGAILNYVALQESHDAFYTIVDLHAITVAHDPKALRESTRTTAALYLASGVDPSKASIFVQSKVPAHAELAWLLQCATPMGWLERMIQFKEKSRKLKAMSEEAEAAGAGDAAADAAAQQPKGGVESVSCGLFTYPVLMAADILLYRADVVPVGEDQKQHIELTRDIANRVNDKFGGRKWKKRGGRGGRVLAVPEPYIPQVGARVMSLSDGTSKMSKSAESDLSRINLLDSPKDIMNKIKRAKTDTFEGLEYGNPERPEATNLLSLYKLATKQSMDDILQECGNMRWGEFKPRLGEALVESLRPLQAEYKALMDDPANIDTILDEGAEKASEVANQTVKDVKDAMGFV